MRKGFLFTFDAALALILVIILAAALAAQQNALPEKGGISDALKQQAKDKAIVQFYLNQPSEGDPDFTLVGYGECTVIYELLGDPIINNLGTRDQPAKKIFCEKK